MSRSLTYSALTLRVKPSGESNREAWFLTAEEGIIHATVFGGPKSRLRSHVAPFHSGTLWIYHDPVRDSRKVNDYDVHSYRMGIRDLWERAMAAGAVAETILSSHGGGGSWMSAMDLAGGTLDALEGANEAGCSHIVVYFLWHWARILGLRPDLSACASCACEAGPDGVLWYSTGEGALFCEKCMRGENQTAFRVGAGARFWLDSVEALSPACLPAFIDALSMEQARSLSQAVLQGAVGRRLSTWDVI